LVNNKFTNAVNPVLDIPFEEVQRERERDRETERQRDRERERERERERTIPHEGRE
jgi:hypothetical protein